MLAALIGGGLGALNTFAGGRFIPDEDLRGRFYLQNGSLSGICLLQAYYETCARVAKSRP
jgi:hypothetical protein